MAFGNGTSLIGEQAECRFNLSCTAVLKEDEIFFYNFPKALFICVLMPIDRLATRNSFEVLVLLPSVRICLIVIRIAKVLQA
jgi:hypothetical protein